MLNYHLCILKYSFANKNYLITIYKDVFQDNQKYFYGPFVPESVLYRETSYKLKLEYTIANKIAINEANKEEQKKIAKKSGVKKNKYKKVCNIY